MFDLQSYSQSYLKKLCCSSIKWRKEWPISVVTDEGSKMEILLKTFPAHLQERFSIFKTKIVIGIKSP